MSTLYVLELEDGKYYVGKTDNIENRFQQHKSGIGGSQWTKIHKPVKIIETRQITSIHDENNVTKDYMKKYGIDNVRGGSYTQEELDDYQEDCLLYEIRCISDCCFKCGRTGHFAKNCSESEEFVWGCEKCDTSFATEQDCNKHEETCKILNTGCARCGRKNHFASNCYAKTHVDGSYLGYNSDYSSE